MTDASKYTGAHKSRFDADTGKGKVCISQCRRKDYIYPRVSKDESTKLTILDMSELTKELEHMTKNKQTNYFLQIYIFSLGKICNFRFELF